MTLNRNPAAVLVPVAAYAALCAATLTSEITSIGGPLTSPIGFIPFVLAFALVHVALGYAIGRWSALAACAIPLVLVLGLAPFIPSDPDVPGFATLVALGLAFFVMPIGAVLVALGVALRRRRIFHRRQTTQGEHMNSIQLVGRLTREPELRETTGGTTVCRMGLAVPRRNRGEDPVYVELKAFDAQAKSCGEHLATGHEVAVTGRLETDKWDAGDGSKRSLTYVIASSVDFLRRPQREADAGPRAAA
jgi:single-strand DNA-binding protein